jgi:hypothetical protein
MLETIVFEIVEVWRDVVDNNYSGRCCQRYIIANQHDLSNAIVILVSFFRYIKSRFLLWYIYM